MIQSIKFNRSLYSLDDSIIFLLRHSIVPLKGVHITKHFYEYRITEPNKYKSFYSKYITDGILFTFQ